MKNKMKIYMIIIFIMMMTSITVSAATFINSKEVIYDNSISGMESTNVQSAVDELYSAATDYSSLNQRISNLENDSKNVINKIYPVGSIYISATDDTIEKVKQRFGGEWEKYSEGRTLVGEGTGTDSNGVVKTFKANATGGEYKHTLTIAEMPSHTHAQRSRGPSNVAAAGGDIGSEFLGDSNKSIGTTFSTGGSKAHNIVQPYITTYMYKRIK